MRERVHEIKEVRYIDVLLFCQKKCNMIFLSQHLYNNVHLLVYIIVYWHVVCVVTSEFSQKKEWQNLHVAVGVAY
jgi:hypothetical protein